MSARRLAKARWGAPLALLLVGCDAPSTTGGVEDTRTATPDAAQPDTDAGENTVCGRWIADRRDRAEGTWIGGDPAQCEPGDWTRGFRTEVGSTYQVTVEGPFDTLSYSFTPVDCR